MNMQDVLLLVATNLATALGVSVAHRIAVERRLARVETLVEQILERIK